MSITIPSFYYGRLATIESGNNPFAKAPTSSASGLYQFTKSTWEGLGLNWADRFSESIQNKAIETLTNQNARYLQSRGATVDYGSLYGAHFLGAGTAGKVYTAPDSDAISRHVSAAQIKANPNVFKNIKTVGDFKDWAAGKFGVGQSSIADVANTAAEEIVGGFYHKEVSSDGSVTVEIGDPSDPAYKGESNEGGGEEDDGGLVGWLKRFFSAATASRFAGVIVGVILVGAAIWALMNSDNNTLTLQPAA